MQKLLLVGCLLVVLSACSKKNIHEETIAELFEASGFNNTLKGYPAEIFETGQLIFEQQKIPSEKLSPAINEMCSFDKLYTNAVDDLKNNKAADVNYLKSLVGLYKSPAVSKLINLEVQAASPETKKAVQAYLLEAKNVSTYPERQALINRLISTRRADKQYIDTKHLISQHIYTSVGAKSLSREEIEKIFQQIKQELIAQTQAVLPLQYQFIYREISNEELKQYAGFYQKEDIQKYIALTQVISEKILANCTKQAIDRLNSARSEAQQKN